MKFLNEIGLEHFISKLKILFNTKVDKVTGKSLSTNDYTTVEKNKLSGIETGANNYAHPTSHPASMITESSTKRFVSDTEKSTWNSKSDTDTITTINGKTGAISKADIVALGIPSQDTVYTHPTTHPYSMITGTPTSLPANGGHALSATHLLGDDTRAVNSAPSVYMNGGSRFVARAGWQTEFKTRTAINSPPLSGSYVYLQTHTPWSDPSGGYPIQIAYGNGIPCWRVGISTTTWSTWQKVSDGGNANTVNGFTVGANVPANAKFTDTNTTYSEISTAEIDAGTSSTLRTITGRRIKYILDKVQGWMNALTKSDVGLSNVDNVKQATKVEFDSHDTNTTKHITSAERTNWNSKETTASSQTKANQAETNAKDYADTELAKKVDKVTGKGLSTEDYTTAEKSKLASVEQNANYTPNLSMDELVLGGRFKIVYNDIEDSLDIEVI